jgi:hypothetical protein
MHASGSHRPRPSWWAYALFVASLTLAGTSVALLATMQ